MLGTYNVNGAPCKLLVEQDALTWWPRSMEEATSAVSTSTTTESSVSSTSPVRAHLRRLSNASSVILSGAGISDAIGNKNNDKQRIEFNQIIGIDNNNNNNKFKIYYAKRNENKTTGRLLKLKKISIESLEVDNRHNNNNEKKKSSNNDNNNKTMISATSDCDPLENLFELIEKQLEIKRRARPRRLLVFVNPYGGKGRAMQLYKRKVRKVLDLAQCECELIVTKYANHARDTIEDPSFELNQFDGIVCIGGDGMFSELMNGLLFRCNRNKLIGPPSSTLNDNHHKQLDQIKLLRSSFGGIGEQFVSPSVPVGVIGAGSTDANLFGFIGTNDAVSATLNIVMGNQIQIDVCSLHSIRDDRLLRFVSTFVAYGYFGDVIRESEKLRWLGPSRYDVTAVNSLIKYRSYPGLVRILRSARDGTPFDGTRCHANCHLCDRIVEEKSTVEKIKCDLSDAGKQAKVLADECDQFDIIEQEGDFIGVNAAVMACRCPQTRKGFSPNNHLSNGCADLILVRPCSRMQYINYLIRTGFTKKSAFDLEYVDAYRCRQFEFIAHSAAQTPTSDADGDETASMSNSGGGGGGSSWNADGEILREHSLRVKVNNRLLRVFGTGEPQRQKTNENFQGSEY